MKGEPDKELSLPELIEMFKNLEGDFFDERVSLTHHESTEDGVKYITFNFKAPKKYQASFSLKINLSDKNIQDDELFKAQVFYGVAHFYTKSLAREWRSHPAHNDVVAMDGYAEA